MPCYRRFLRRFPTLGALASAREPEVLRLWAGLGYYSRARNLLRAARTVAKGRGGRFPSDFDGVLSLPGVGRYTAGAILSIAFGRPVPVLDGNVARVLSRLFALREDPRAPAARARLWSLAERLLDRRRPGDWNQALMELGALVCVPRGPRCGRCPVSGLCAARRRGLEDSLPAAGARRAPVDLVWTALWIERDGRVLLHRRGEEERFLPGHWGLPEARHLGPAAARRLPLKRVVRHSITFHRIRLEVRSAAPPPGPPPPSCRWVRKTDLRRRLVSSLWLKAL